MKIREKYGETAHQLVKLFEQHEKADIDRVMKHADRIILMGEPNKAVAVAEALQYEVTINEDFESLRIVVQRDAKGNAHIVERMRIAGVDVPQDIMDMI